MPPSAKSNRCSSILEAFCYLLPLLKIFSWLALLLFLFVTSLSQSRAQSGECEWVLGCRREHALQEHCSRFSAAAAAFLSAGTAGGKRAGPGVSARVSQSSGSFPWEWRRASAPEEQDQCPHYQTVPGRALCREDRHVPGYVREGKGYIWLFTINVSFVSETIFSTQVYFLMNVLVVEGNECLNTAGLSIWPLWSIHAK